MTGKIVYAYVVADLLHMGHVLFLENAKTFAGSDGKLIVGVLTDEATMEKKPKPTLPLSERMKLVQSLKCVDITVAQDTYSPLKNVMAIKPDILIESSSHSEMPANEYMISQGKKVVALPYYSAQSSSNIKESIINTKRQMDELNVNYYK
ncbi:adenylyltransferase/cytidyltransferase family protein [Candidatus Pacearchaeota archaeon]|nr:adenylyltransferase/cytidyltransferase family protein [Candidatus Pacearchaeota archaeon]